MRRGRALFAIGTALLVILGSVACSGTTEDETTTYNAEEWTWLEQTADEMEAKREELAKLKAASMAAASEVAEEVEEGMESAEAALTPEERAEQTSALEDEINTLRDDMGARLPEFINSLGIVEGAELTDVQRGALRMNSELTMMNAQEFIDKGGDYQRALDLYSQALLYDADNEKLHAAVAHAEDMRYINEERFATVKKKMTQAEVIALLGPVNLRNIREYEDDGITAWFYRKEGGGAAGVFFQEKNGALRVYKTDYEAVKVEGGDEG